MTDILKIKKWLEEADYILIGAGAGLSESAGLHYSGKKFRHDFIDYIKKYRITDLYTSSFYPFKTEEERWAYWAKHIYYSYYEPKQTEAYQNLLSLVKEKEYFVITTNCDGQFLNNGFDPKKIFEVQGSYSKIQCEKGCHNKLYNNKKLIFDMLNKTNKELKIPSDLVPKCPVCGGKMTPNLRCDEHFIEDRHWEDSQRNYINFVENAMGKNILLLELGIGFNTPGIIRFPFEKMTFMDSNTKLIRFNKHHPKVPKEIKEKSIEVKEDINSVIRSVKKLNFSSKKI